MNALLRFAKHPCLHLVFNIAYALVNLALGIWDHSNWFLMAGMYYAVLSIARFSILQMQRYAEKLHATALYARRFMGALLLVMSMCLAAMNTLSAFRDRGTVHHEIIMITIALFTFIKITLSIIGMVRAKHVASPILRTLRDLSLADSLVSVCSLQRSMVVTFHGLTPEEIRLLNILTGTAVWAAVTVLGVHLIGGKYVDMTKSKVEKGIKNISASVTDGYKKIERGVVDGYKKIEKGVVDGYTRIEDKFVKNYLTKEGETVEQAKERLSKEK